MGKQRTPEFIRAADDFIKAHAHDMSTSEMAEELGVFRGWVLNRASKRKTKLTYSDHSERYDKRRPVEMVAYTLESLRFSDIEKLVFCRKW